MELSLHWEKSEAALTSRIGEKPQLAAVDFHLNVYLNLLVDMYLMKSS